MMIRFTREQGLGLWMLTSLLYYAAAQQEGYISVDCGASANSTDPDTLIQWTTDAPYISTGVNQILSTVPSSSLNERQLKTLRYFPANRSRHCYTLPASKNSAYLLRATFLHGGFQTEVDNEFDLSIDSTVVDSVAWSPDYVDTLWTVEYVVASTSNRVNFCLIPKAGVSFISTLELRPLAEGMYVVVLDGKYLKSLVRINCGAQPTDPPIRYPQDLYDRMWYTPGDSFTYNTTTTTSDIDLPLDTVTDRPPLAVMQSAWVSSVNDTIGWALSLSEYELNKTSNFYTNHFFAEIENTGPSDSRFIDMDVNGEEALHNISFNKFEASQIYNVDRTITIPWANYTFSSSAGSVLGPLLNAVEFYASRDAIQSSTDDRDVGALEVVKNSLGLSSWTGDPCLPVSYNWLTCNGETNPRVTKIDLTGYDLVGTIPASIAELTALTELLLDNNKIRGGIPDLSKLVELTILHLQDNLLTGGIPSTLASLPVLTELFLSNNNLSGPIPAALADRSSLKLETSGNVKLCAPTENCPILPTDLPDDSNSEGGGGGAGTSAAVVIGVIVGGVLVLAVIGVSVCLYCRKRPKPILTLASMRINTRDQKGASQGLNASSIASGSVGGAAAVNQARAFSLAELGMATQNFESKIGNGGFGPVYYGKLPDGTELAVKVKSATSNQGTTEFFNEVSLLSRVHHKNLVALLGYCDENGQEILVYEYMPEGTLSEHLYGKDMKGQISWKQRLEIALNAAQGLVYLHNDCIPKIIHRDIKSTNILLNDKLLAKVADFGIWKLAPDEDQTSCVSTKIIGTPGYLDPEYHQLNKLTQKSDVYSFGVVLLEIICGRSPHSPDAGHNLVQWARGNLRINDLGALVDPAMVDSYNVEAMWKVAELALSCVEPSGVNRPDMKQVVRGLSEASELDEARTQDYGPPAGGVGRYSGKSFSSGSSYPSKQGSATTMSIPEYPGPNQYPSAPLLQQDLFSPTTTTTFQHLPLGTGDSSRLAPR